MGKFMDNGLLGWRGALQAAAGVILFLVALVEGVTALRLCKLPSALPFYGVLAILVINWGVTVVWHYRASKARREGGRSLDAVAVIANVMFLGLAVSVWVLCEAIIELEGR